MKQPEKLLSAKEIAAALDITSVTLGAWKKDGMPFVKGGRPPQGDGFSLKDIVAWMTTNGKTGKAGHQTKPSSSLDEEKLLKIAAERRLLECRYKALRGSYLKRRDVEAELIAIVSQFRAAFERLGDGLNLDRPAQLQVNEAARKALITFTKQLRTMPKQIAAEAVEKHNAKVTGENEVVSQ